MLFDSSGFKCYMVMFAICCVFSRVAVSQIDQKIIYSIMDELIYKLSVNDQPEIARYVATFTFSIFLLKFLSQLCLQPLEV